MHKYETTNLLELVNSRLELLGVKDQNVLLGLRAITGEYLKKSIGGCEFLNDEIDIIIEYAEDSIKYTFKLIYTDCENSIEVVKLNDSIQIGMFLDHEFYIVKSKGNVIETDETKELTYIRTETLMDNGEIKNTNVKRYDGESNTTQEANITPIGVKFSNSEFYNYNNERIMSVPRSRYEENPNIIYLSNLIEETKREFDKDIVKENIKQRRLQK